MIDLTTQPLVFVDTETTGFSPESCRLIEVAFIRVVNGEVVDKFVSFVKHDEPIPEFITGLTGINNEMVKDAPAFEDLIPQIDKIVEGAIFVAHNAQFDYNFFRASYARAGKSFNVPRVCTVELSRRLYPQMKRHKLADLISKHGFDYTERHRAEDDAAVLIQFFDKCKLDHGVERLQSAVLVV